MAKNPFQQLDVIRNASQKGNVITDCYRLMYNKKLWFKAYTELYPNARNMVTKGTKAASLHDLALKEIDDIIEQLKAGTFYFESVSRAHFPKINGKQQMVQAPNFKDTLVQEVIKIILENVFEPIFSNNSHGLREGSCCHTALSQIKNTWHGITWCMAVNLESFYEQMDHTVLLKLISKKINDRRFLLIIQNALTCGVLKTRMRQKTFSCTPQSCMLSSVLANIYLHELDLFMDNTQRIKYVRYTGSFVVGIVGSKQMTYEKKNDIMCFLHESLNLNLNDETTHITHLNRPVPFLGYEFRKYNRIRTHKSTIQLEIPKTKIVKFANEKGYGNVDNFKIVHRKKLVNNSELEILNTYNTELRAIANYYKLANNYHQLNSLFYLAQSSFIKTIANKRRSTSSKVFSNMKKHKQGSLCLVGTDKQGNEKIQQFVKLKDLPKYKHVNGSRFICP
ncbi:reverse transcriptase/maturase family protein [Terrihalobacillus insolitus]|uniref:reverse transcriptase/maturase family protein n=1 Tax=Terrihalobacillus insolitus TaxID=2950438 RepID=UPI00234227C7|nr:reverse transcriptase/maturase family protein [Terrihalobacillus insolitus]MDC3412473.1 reverse transcriptase domain-containing protein [Terrihalobacillus insolitus]